MRTAVLSMGRKNGKIYSRPHSHSVISVALKTESRGEVYCCANDRFQAGRIFSEMTAMVRNHPWLSDRINISRFMKQLEDLENGSIYAALSSEAKTKMGLSPSFVVYDELGQTTDRELYDAMDSAMGGRKDPLLLVISTQAAIDLAPMSQLVDYGLRICRGEIKDPAFHLTLHTAPPDEFGSSQRAHGPGRFPPPRGRDHFLQTIGRLGVGRRLREVRWHQPCTQGTRRSRSLSGNELCHPAAGIAVSTMNRPFAFIRLVG